MTRTEWLIVGLVGALAVGVAMLPSTARAGLSPDTCVAGPNAGQARAASVAGRVSGSWFGGQPHLITVAAARDIWGWEENGELVSGVDTLQQAMDALAAVAVPSATGSEGVPVTFANVPGYTPATGSHMAGSNVEPSFALLRCLRDAYGADIGIAYGANYPQTLSGLTTQQIHADTCGVQQRYVDNGFLRSWGAYAYADGKLTSSAQSNVASCFGFARVYAAGLNRYTSLITSPYKLVTLSVAGGNCNRSGLACSSVFHRNYMLPAAITSALLHGAGYWTSIQLYHLVTGSRQTGYTRWDCTSPNPADHWTNRGEFYCQRDFTSALARALATQTPGSFRFIDPASGAYITGRGHPAGAS